MAYTLETLELNAKDELSHLPLEINIATFPHFLGYHPNLSEYRSVLVYARAVSKLENTIEPEITALKLLTILGNAQEAINFILWASQISPDSKQPVHDACLFTLPEESISKKSLTIWQTLAKRFLKNQRFRSIAGLIVDLEEKLGAKKKDISQRMSILRKTEQELTQNIREIRKSLNLIGKDAPLNEKGPLEERIKSAENALSKVQIEISSLPLIDASISLNKLEDFALSLQYTRYHEAPEAARLFIKHKIPEKYFNEYIDLDKKDAGLYIPKIIIDGADIGYPGYYMTKLDPADPRCAVLGELTGCCQSIHGLGRKYTIYGLTNKRAGFYAIFKGNPNRPSSEDQIYAQSLIWNARGSMSLGHSYYLESLIFDTIEYSSSVSDPAHMMMAKKFYEAAAEKLLGQKTINEGEEEHFIHGRGRVEFVGVGSGGATPNEIGFELWDTPDLARDMPRFIKEGDASHVRGLAIQINQSDVDQVNLVFMIGLCNQIYLKKFDISTLEKCLNSYYIKRAMSHFLYLAAITQQYELCRTLIVKGANPKCLNFNGESLLAIALYQNDSELLKIALSSGGSFSQDKAGHYGEPMPVSGYLLEHASEPSIAFIQSFLAQEKGLLFALLEHAISCSWIQSLEWILSQPQYLQEINTQSNLPGMEVTAMEFARIYNDPRVIALFQKYNINPLDVDAKETPEKIVEMIKLSIKSENIAIFYVFLEKIKPILEVDDVVREAVLDVIFLQIVFKLKRVDFIDAFMKLFPSFTLKKEGLKSLEGMVRALVWRNASPLIFEVLLKYFPDISSDMVLMPIGDSLYQGSLSTDHLKFLNIYKKTRGSLKPNTIIKFEPKSLAILLLLAQVYEPSLVKTIIGDIAGNFMRSSYSYKESAQKIPVLKLIKCLQQFKFKVDGVSDQEIDNIINQIIDAHKNLIDFDRCYSLFHCSDLSQKILNMLDESNAAPGWRLLFLLANQPDSTLFTKFFNKRTEALLEKDMREIFSIPTLAVEKTKTCDLFINLFKAVLENLATADEKERYITKFMNDLPSIKTGKPGCIGKLMRGKTLGFFDRNDLLTPEEYQTLMELLKSAHAAVSPRNTPSS